MQGELTRILQQSVQDCARPAREVAMEAGKPYPLLMRELNPMDLRAKVGVEMLVPIMRATGNLAPLAHVARSMDQALVPLNLRIDDETSREGRLLALMESVGRFCRAVRHVLSSKQAAPEELRRMEQAQSEAASAMASLTEALKREHACVEPS